MAPHAARIHVDELRRTRSMVTIAVGFLFPSIVSISILLAFAAASIAVIPDNQSIMEWWRSHH